MELDTAIGRHGGMSKQAISGESTNHLAAWLAFATSPVAPKQMMSALELDGYLTGVIVSPSFIPPSRWMAGLWGSEEPASGNDAQAAQIESVLGAVSGCYNGLTRQIEQSLRRLEASKVCDYRPAFQPVEGKPPQDAITAWVRGFWRAMSLSPNDWSGLIEDKRTQVLMVPFVGFMKVIEDKDFEPLPDIDERLDEAAAAIPRAILLLRKIAEIRAARPSHVSEGHLAKVGRNEPCPCGSGKKFKRCCGSG